MEYEAPSFEISEGKLNMTASFDQELPCEEINAFL
jgi:hypothetical protein